MGNWKETRYAPYVLFSNLLIYLLHFMQKWIGILRMSNTKGKVYLLELKKNKVTRPFLQNFYQEDMEVPEVAKDILSGDSEDSLQKLKHLIIATSD